MSSHTPGPWSFDNDWRRFPTVFGADGIKVAIVERDKDINGFVYDLPERYANARLITAAPDMLNALKAIRIYVEVLEKHLDPAVDAGAPTIREHAAMARAAIAKAEGLSLTSPVETS